MIIRLTLLLVMTALPALGDARESRTPSTTRASHDVIMYALPECPYCVKARAYLKARGITWREFDIAADAAAEARFKALGGLGTPLILIDGQRVAGFDEPRISALLAKDAAPHFPAPAGATR